MPGYITKQFKNSDTRYQNVPNILHLPQTRKKYGTAAQKPTKPYDSKPTLPKLINRIQKIFRSILYYARYVDPTILMALSTLSSEQNKATM